MIYGAYIDNKGHDIENKLKEALTSLKTKIKVEFTYGQETLYLGASPDTMPDDMTMGEFKKEVNEIVKEVLGPEYNCTWHEESWYNG